MSFFRLIGKISIGQYFFDYVNEVEVNSSWENLTDTAKITLPKKLSFKNKPLANGADALFKKGDKVKIELGYAGKLLETLNTVFEGYISAIKPNVPFTIECEDAMWLLKQSTVTKSWKSVSLKALLFDTVNGLDVIADDIELGQFRVTRVTPAQILQELKEKYGLYSWVRDGKLYCGKVGSLLNANIRKFVFQEDVISADLAYLRKNDIKIKVKGISILPNNTKIEVEEGDSDGELRTFNYYNLKEADLRKVVKEDAARLRYEGYKGNFESFLLPFVRHGDIALLDDLLLPDRKGKYLIKSVNTTFGQGGGRQKIEIDRKL
jgi:hypothetical protein